MKEVRFFYVPDAATQQELPEEEAQHAVRVLRMESGDEMSTVMAVLLVLSTRSAMPDNCMSGRG